MVSAYTLAAFAAVFTVALAATKVTFQDLPQNTNEALKAGGTLVFKYDNTAAFPADSSTQVFIDTPKTLIVYPRTTVECTNLQTRGLPVDGFQEVSCTVGQDSLKDSKKNQLFLKNKVTGKKSSYSSTFFTSKKQAVTLHRRGAAKDAADKAEKTTDDVQNKGKEAADKAKSKSGEVKDKAQDTAEDAKNRAGDAADKTKEKANEAGDVAKDTAEKGKGWFKSMTDSISGVFRRRKQDAKDLTVKAADKTKEGAESTKKAVEENINSAASLSVDSFKIALAVAASLIGIVTLA